MKNIVFLLIFFTSFSYAADDFSSRAKAGLEAAKTAQGQKYQQSIGSFIGEAMYSCVLSQPYNAKEPDKFTLIADVNHAGQLVNVIVQPLFKASTCFTDTFSKHNFPVPPQENSTSSGYPITITILTKH